MRSVTMLCVTDGTVQNIPHIHAKCGQILCKILSVQQNIVMEFNNVMQLQL